MDSQGHCLPYTHIDTQTHTHTHSYVLFRILLLSYVQSREAHLSSTESLGNSMRWEGGSSNKDFPILKSYLKSGSDCEAPVSLARGSTANIFILYFLDGNLKLWRWDRSSFFAIKSNMCYDLPLHPAPCGLITQTLDAVISLCILLILLAPVGI